MDITNINVVNFYNACKTLTLKRLPITFAYAIRFNMKSLASALESYEEARMSILNKYAETNKDGSFITDDEGKIELKDGAMEEINELLNIHIEANIKTVDIYTIERAESDEFDNITMQELDAIMFMID